MKHFTIFLLVVSLIYVGNVVQGLEQLMGTPMQSCLNCLCHARSGCWSRFNCARYSISQDYWKQGGSHTPGPVNDLNEGYRSCMSDENCILNTLKGYTEQFGEVDCNCDDVFDCKDRLAIHLFGKDCKNPDYGAIYSTRFNDCANQIGVQSMSAKEGNCLIPEVEVF